MPYIGNQHNVGDHVNNFKVLDDISSHTATFDGSATSVVSAADDTIRIPEHRFIQGQRVTYTNGGGGNIGGLTTGTAYFVSFDSPNTIKLATTLANANSNTVINISAVGSGTSHTLNAAFDGINTKFKITYSSGTSARLNNATQINVAINNVIQRPNQSSLSFTEGFAIEDNHKIVFKVAPTVNDIFWGSIIANTIENFDLRDNEVDNFTGDGSTTEFTLSTIPANNESVVVSIDGVLQHPSDSTTVRAYTLIDSIIQFTDAPALNTEIQVRHIGFAGASTNDVSGFYGRSGNVTLTANDHITTGDITSRNTKATGISTVVNLDVDDFIDVGSNIKIGHAGVITATSFVGSGANLTGIDATAVKDSGGNVKIQAQASGAVYTGIHTFTTLKSTSADFSGNVSIGGTLTYEDVTNIDSVGIITARNGIDCNGDIDVDGHTNLDNGNVAGIVTFNSGSALHTNGGQILLFDRPDGSSNNLFFGTGGKAVAYHDGTNFSIVNNTGHSYIGVGVGSKDLYLYAQASGNVLLQQNTGVRYVKGVGSDASVQLFFNNNLRLNTTTAGVSIPQDLDVDGHTNLDNVSIAGVATATTFVGALTGTASGNPTLTSGANNRVVTATGANAIQGETGLTFDGNNFEVTATSGRIKINSTGPAVNFIDTNADSDYMLQVDGGIFKLVDLTNSDAIRLQVASNGNVAIAKDLDVDGHTNLDNVSIAGVTTFTGFTLHNDHVSITDSKQLRLGASNDLTLEHNGSDSYITSNTGNFVIQHSNNSGDFEIKANDFYVKSYANEIYMRAQADGAVELYHNNVKKLETTANGILIPDGQRIAFDTDNYITCNNTANTLEFVVGGTGVGEFFSSGFRFNDSQQLRVGSANDTRFYHSGSHSYIKHTGTGNFYIDVNSNDYFQVTGEESETLISAQHNGAVDLFFNGSRKLRTKTAGVEIEGELGMADNYKIKLGTGEDLQIFHDGSGNRINANNGNLTIQAVTQHDIVLSHAGADMIRCKPDGEVELNYSGSMKFETRTDGVLVSGDIYNATNLNSTGDKGFSVGNGNRLGFDQSGTRSWNIKATGGNLEFKSGDGSGIHYFYTDVTSSGYVDSASDIKLKTNIKTIDNALDKVLQLRGVEYDRIDRDNQHEIGVIAQEVEKVIPEVVHGEDIKTVSYGNMVAVLIEAIKEQNEMINKMKKEIEDLKG